MDGVLNVFKPIGMTSFDVVRKIKKIAGTKKVGHGGTLDPLATGVLPIFIGKSTKIIQYVMDEEKVYDAELRLGIKTDTYDREGTIISSNDMDLHSLKENDIVNTINSFKGEIKQVPPMYSALKKNGKKLYELARMGIEIQREERTVKIYSIDINEIELPFIRFKVTCSKGTYIRSLCYDIGEKLNCGGTMWNLQRTSTGSFTIENSKDIDTFNSENIKKYLLKSEEVLLKYQPLDFSVLYEKSLLNGVPINYNNNHNYSKIYRVYCNQIFIGLGKNSIEGFRIIRPVS